MIAITDREVSQVLAKTKVYTSLQTLGVFAGIDGKEDECLITVKELEYELLLESKTEGLKQQINIEEEDVYRGIQDVREAVKEEKKSSQQFVDEFAKLQQREDLRQFDEAEIKGIRCEGFEKDNSKYVVEQWRRYLHALNIF